MQASQIPTLVPLAFAANGTKNTIPEASQIGITNGAASLNDGFPPLCSTPVAAGGVPPFGADFNGILNLITQTVRWKHAGGQFGYNSTFANDTNVGGYPRGALLLRSDQSGMWLNQTDSNTTNPDTGGAGWAPAFMSGVVGQVRNLVMSVAAASASATLTADEIVVGSAFGGQKYVLASFNKTINLATTGAGGMDTGSAPTSGYVALYAIYNPTTGASALLATNATSAKQPNVYGGANMPSGYTASALVSVYPTNSSGQLVIGYQSDRTVRFKDVSVLSGSSTVAEYTSLSIASAVPLNAVTVSGWIGVAATAASSSLYTEVSGSSTGISRSYAQANGSQNINASFTLVPIITPQTIFIAIVCTGTVATTGAGVSGYTF